MKFLFICIKNTKIMKVGIKLKIVILMNALVFVW